MIVSSWKLVTGHFYIEIRKSQVMERKFKILYIGFFHIGGSINGSLKWIGCGVARVREYTGSGGYELTQKSSTIVVLTPSCYRTMGNLRSSPTV